MSYIKVNISDKDSAVSGDIHGSMTDQLIAALTAEPETITEFETALERFVKTESDWKPLRGFSKHEDLEPYDAGIVAIDLRGRVVGYDTTYSIPSREGGVKVPREFADGHEDIYIPYRLPGDWLFVKSIPAFEGSRARMREEREKNFPYDARPILYGRLLLKFIAEEVAAADLDSIDYSEIHARWLMEPRSELRGKSPRDIFFEKQKFIDYDLHSRSTQWSFTKVCPPPLDTESFAYKNAGFGTHEWVMHYYLVRHLMYDCVEQRETYGSFEIDAEIDRLKSVRDVWLRTPDPESSGRVPLAIIDHERIRKNLTVSAQEALIDENCPCCVAMAEDFDTPMFSFIDGCNMDDRFEFSPYKTRDEWEAEQRRWEEFNKEYNEKLKNKPDSAAWFEDTEEPF